MPDWVIIIVSLVVAWFIIDMASRIYLMYAPWEDYKEDRTEDTDKPYRAEKEAEAVEVLSRYRVGRWLLKQRRK
jgi:hypothetical protein